MSNIRSKSRQIFEKMCAVIPGGVNSPVRAFRGLERSPIVVASAKGDLLVDADGNRYIDFCGSWGALILGHADPYVLSATQRRMERGTSFGCCSETEETLAQQIVQMIPTIEKIRFVSSGTEATMSAVRLARGFTKRDLIIKFDGNFHGHADFFLVKAGSGLAGWTATSSSAGIPASVVENTMSLPYNDLEASLRVFQDPQLRNKIAAVILEPVSGNMGVVPPSIEFLQMLREETKKCGALLIFDEVITGFRVSKGGAQKLFDVQPDITTFGKIIGGGFPVAAYGGRADIMEMLSPLGPVYQAGTLSGNPVAMEAGYQTLCRLGSDSFYQELSRKTDIITVPVKAAIEQLDADACIQQVGSMFSLFFGKRKVGNFDDALECDTEIFKEYFGFLFDRGVYVSPSQFEANFISMAHTIPHLERARDLMLEFIYSRYGVQHGRKDESSFCLSCEAS